MDRSLAVQPVVDYLAERTLVRSKYPVQSARGQKQGLLSGASCLELFAALAPLNLHLHGRRG
jgi:hypothetical protein